MSTAEPPTTIPLAASRPGWVGRSPFAAAAPAVVSAVGFALATVVWVVGGAALPGGRWLAVHLFTLGVLTPLVVAFSQHFAARFCPTTGTDGGHDDATRWSWATIGTLDVAVVVTVVGRAADLRPALALGATGVTAVVLVSWWRLRGRRRAAPDTRFAWIVRVYERAHGAFVHGAVLGVVLGLGLVPATWYLGVRQAHLHANVLGWGGLTLLATLVVFGPGIARTRMVPGADVRAGRALRAGATALTVALVGLLLTGLEGGAGLVARGVAATGLATLAVVAAVVCWPVLRAAVTATSDTRLSWPVAAICAWLPGLVLVDAVVVAAGANRWFDVLGLVALVAVLGRALLTVLVFLAPVLRARTPAAREAVRTRVERGAVLRSVVIDVGVVAVAAGIVGQRIVEVGEVGTVVVGGLVTLGWGLIGASVLAHLAVLLLPVPRGRRAQGHPTPA